MEPAPLDPSVPWIEPRTAHLASSRRELPTSEILLGGVPRGAVIVVCPADSIGLDAPLVMNRLAEHGYESVAVGVEDGDTGGPAELAAESVAVALERLAGRGWRSEQVGVVGYGVGGAVAAAAATLFDLGAVVSVAPVWARRASAALGDLAERARSLRAPWLGLFGEQDRGAPPAGLDALGRALAEQAPVFARIVAYPGVSGPIHRDAASPLAHAAAFDSWQRTVEWLDLRIVPRPTPLAEAWLHTRS